jgi:hypothetical protein
MKFYFSVALSAILMLGKADAQHTDNNKHVNIGVKGGLNLYNVNSSSGSSYSSKTGLHLGLIGHIHLNRQWAVQPELVYSMQGAKFNSGNSKLKLDYINVPVLLQYMFDNGFRIQAGPQVGFLINSKVKTGSTSVDVKDDFRMVEIAVGAGVGYIDVPSGFGVDARYNIGLNNINKSSSVKSTNRGFQFGVFYLFKHS